jgi:tyrosyl-tRNA synthetase
VTLTSSLSGLLPELDWRGMLEATTPGLESRLASGRRIEGYNGFDPSGPSLHIGSLVPIFGLLHLQRHGGIPIALVGGANGMIGDPSGRSSERNLLDRETIEANVASIRGQLERFLDFGPGSGARLVNNLDWLEQIGLIEFLRDVGKHFTIPYMLAKDSVQVRLDRGLSYTEFSYMLLQAADFEHLHRTMGVELQMGGADQWGNITAGLELIRRRAGGDAHGLAYKLLLTPSGTKFGKSEDGESIWLDPERTSPYAFYQYWLNTDDRDVGTYLRWFTLLDRQAIEGLEAELADAPDVRSAQRALAYDLTTRVHGTEAANRAISAAEAAFKREPITDPDVLRTLNQYGDGFTFTDEQRRAGVARFLVDTGVLGSLGEARRLIAGSGLSIGDMRPASPDDIVPEPAHGEWLVVRLGKKRVIVGHRAP